MTTLEAVHKTQKEATKESEAQIAAEAATNIEDSSQQITTENPQHVAKNKVVSNEAIKDITEDATYSAESKDSDSVQTPGEADIYSSCDGDNLETISVEDDATASQIVYDHIDG